MNVFLLLQCMILYYNNDVVTKFARLLSWSWQDWAKTHPCIQILYQKACKILTWSWLDLVKIFLCTKKHARYLHGLGVLLVVSRFTWQELCKKLTWFISQSCKNLSESYQNHEYTLHDSCFIFVQESYKFHDKNLANILEGFLARPWPELLLGIAWVEGVYMYKVKWSLTWKWS